MTCCIFLFYNLIICFSDNYFSKKYRKVLSSPALSRTLFYSFFQKNTDAWNCFLSICTFFVSVLALFYCPYICEKDVCLQSSKTFTRLYFVSVNSAIRIYSYFIFIQTFLHVINSFREKLNVNINKKTADTVHQ